MIRRPPMSTLSSSSAASDVYKRQVYALIYEVTVQDDAWDKKDVEPEEMWFGVFFYQNKNILHRCRSPPLKFGNLLISNFGGRK